MISYLLIAPAFTNILVSLAALVFDSSNADLFFVRRMSMVRLRDLTIYRDLTDGSSSAVRSLL